MTTPRTKTAQLPKIEITAEADTVRRQRFEDVNAGRNRAGLQFLSRRQMDSEALILGYQALMEMFPNG